jgi:hypothetical protein
MGKKLVAAVGFIGALAVTAVSGQAAPITQMLGTADFTDGQTAIGTGNFIANPHGDPAPFNTLIGNKSLMNNNPMTSFTFSAYGTPMASSITSATIEFGLYDGASPSPSTEVKSFTLNTTDDLSTVLTAALVASNPIVNGERYYTLNIPSTDFTALASGSSTFFLQFTGPGEALLGPSNSILFGLDFATLTINTGQVPPATPEPSTILLLLTGLGCLVAFTRWIRRQPDQAFVKA